MSPDAPLTLEVPVDLVDEDSDNARQTFDPASLKVLGESLREQQLAAIIVRKAGERYLLVDGARRLRAAKPAGLKTLRADIYAALDEKTAAIAAATANLQREDLTPHEEARAYQRLLDPPIKWTKKDICGHFGIAFNTLQARLELLELPEAVAQQVGRDGFNIGHAQAVLSLAKHPEHLAVALKALAPDEDGERPDAKNCGYPIGRALVDAGLVRSANDYEVARRAGFDTVNDLAQHLQGLEIVQVGLEGYGLNRFYVDPAAFDKRVAELAEENKAKKAQPKPKKAKPAPAAKQTKTFTEVQDEEEAPGADVEEVEAEARTLWRAAVVQHLGNKQHLASAAWALLVEALEASRYEVDGTDGWQPAGEAAAAVIGADAKLVAKALAAVDAQLDEARKAPKWFSSLQPAKQLAFVTAFWAASQYYGMEEFSHFVTGKEYDSFQDKAEALLEAEAEKASAGPSPAAKAKGTKALKALQTPAKPKKAPKAKLSHEDKKKPAGGASVKGPARAQPANKAGKDKAPAKTTPAVAKARAKLSKGKQATLVAAPAPVEPAAPSAPASSPREIADRVLAGVLPSLKAMKQAATDSGIQA